MSSKQRKKAIDDVRRNVGREYGFRQNSYINFKTEKGYFFCLYFDMDDVRLTVKPLCADELWWNIIDASDCIDKPVSFRGLGQYALPGMVLASFGLSINMRDSDISEMADALHKLFSSASATISAFLITNPDAGSFIPDSVRSTSDPEGLLYLISLLHLGRNQEVIAAIDSMCDENSAQPAAYKYICQYINRDSAGEKLKAFFCRLIFTSPLRRPTSKRSKSEECQAPFTPRPWYRRVRPGITISVVFILFILLYSYFSDLHRRTIYEMTWRAWTVLILFALVCILIFAGIKKLLNKYIGFSSVFSFQALLCFFPVLIVIPLGFIALFDGTNRLFASRDVSAFTAVVTDEKYKYKNLHSRGGTTYSYYSVVRLVDEDRSIKIESKPLYELPKNSLIQISYRKGLFGFDVIDNIYYYPEQYDVNIR